MSKQSSKSTSRTPKGNQHHPKKNPDTIETLSLRYRFWILISVLVLAGIAIILRVE
jgi:hypothetical protein